MAKKRVMGNATRALSKDEVKSILNATLDGITTKNGSKFRKNIQMYNIIYFQLYLGLRIGDIVKLQEKNISNGRVILVEEKTGKQLNKAIPNVAIDYIEGLKTGDPERYFFSIQIRAVQKNLKIICDALNLKNVSTHSFRKSYGTMMFQQTKNIEVVRMALNHSSIAITQRYIGMSNEDLENACSNISFTW